MCAFPADRLSRMAKSGSTAEMAAVINHPNICTVYEVGEYEGGPFIAMELLEGETLRQRIASRPVPPDQSGSIGDSDTEASGGA